MDTNQNTTMPLSNASPGIFGTKVPSAVTFLVAILLFFLPFADIRCNDISIQKINGIEFATGFRIKGPMQNNSLTDTIATTSEAKNKKEKHDPDAYALVALGLGLLGFVVSLLNYKVGGFGGMLTGVLAAASLIGLMFDIKKNISNELLKKEENFSINVQFTPFFYITILLLLAAAFFSYRRMKTGST